MDEANRVLQRRLQAQRASEQTQAQTEQAASRQTVANRRRQWNQVQALIPRVLTAQKQLDYPDMVGVAFSRITHNGKRREEGRTVAAWRLGSYIVPRFIGGEDASATNYVALLSHGELVYGYDPSHYYTDLDNVIFQHGNLTEMVQELRRLVGLE